MELHRLILQKKNNSCTTLVKFFLLTVSNIEKHTDYFSVCFDKTSLNDRASPRLLGSDNISCGAFASPIK